MALPLDYQPDADTPRGLSHRAAFAAALFGVAVTCTYWRNANWWELAEAGPGTEMIEWPMTGQIAVSAVVGTAAGLLCWGSTEGIRWAIRVRRQRRV